MRRSQAPLASRNVLSTPVVGTIPSTAQVHSGQQSVELDSTVSDSGKRILLEHGDVIVWGGPSRMRFHGVQPLKPGYHTLTGPYRYNLTLRKVT